MNSKTKQISSTICASTEIDIDEMFSVRKNRGKLFGEQYFTNKFWDIILLLYSSEINAVPIDANAIAKNLESTNRSALRYLQVLLEDDIICARDETAETGFDLARDNLSLTRLGFNNVETIVEQTRKVFASPPTA